MRALGLEADGRPLQAAAHGLPLELAQHIARPGGGGHGAGHTDLLRGAFGERRTFGGLFLKPLSVG